MLFENPTDESKRSEWLLRRQNLPFVKYMDGIDHSVVYNAKTDILIDLTYRQFLIGKISDKEFEKLPRIFIGSLSDFRQLVSAHLGHSTVDRMFLSSTSDLIGINTTNPNKPTLLQLESGEKTYLDVLAANNFFMDEFQDDEILPVPTKN